MAGYPKPIANKAKRPHSGVPLDSNVILELIYKYRGNLSKIADALGSNRNSIRNKITREPALEEALEESRERWIDDIEESVLSRADASNDTALQCFILKTRGKERGYEQNDAKHTAQDIATAAFEYISNKSKNPAE